MHTLHFPIQPRTPQRPRASVLRAPAREPHQPPSQSRSEVLLYISPSTTPFSTMPFTQTLVHCILDICIALQLHCTRYLELQRMPTGELSFGVMPTQEVCLLCHSPLCYPLTVSTRPSERSMHSSLLHGALAALATPSCPCTNRPDGSSMHAF
jgi:hypothetical protein